MLGRSLLKPFARWNSPVLRQIRCASQLSVSNLSIQKTTSPKPKPEPSTLVFGKSMTDHMLVSDWKSEAGWGKPEITPYGPFAMDPASLVLHYGLEIFEGMKAYRDQEGQVRLFRPDMNMKRMNKSAERMCLPNFDGKGFLDCITRLVDLERDWVPDGRGYSLYIRPTMIATDAALGVAPPHEARLFCITCPVGPYYKEGFAPVSLWAEEKYNRAFPGGTGDAKAGGNYGPTIKPQTEAAQRGYSQVLWLFGEEKHITEVGTMNMFVVWENNGKQEVVTAPLDGTILPGVTRDSIIHLCRAQGLDVNERYMSMDEFVEALNKDKIVEVFGAGTAAIISPVNKIHYGGKDLDIPLDKDDSSAKIGKLASKLFNDLLDIQHGVQEGPEGWSIIV